MKNPVIAIVIFLSALATAVISYPLVSTLLNTLNFGNQFLTTLLWSGYIVLLIFLIIVLPIAYVMSEDDG